MKRKSLSILFALFAIMVSAQSGHLKFMGIPINGTINEFQNKLLAKGFRVDTFSKSIPLGTRMFNGMFMGKKANIYVYYIPVTKTVYRAKACIEKEDEKQIKSLYDETQSMLEDKYIGFSSPKRSVKIENNSVIHKNAPYLLSIFSGYRSWCVRRSTATCSHIVPFLP